MVNIAIILGNGPIGEDSLKFGPWVEHISENHDLYIISRIDSDVHMSKSLRCFVGEGLFNKLKNQVKRLEICSKGFFVIYKSEYFQKNYKIEEINELQSWLGISFSYISSFDRRFYNKKNMKDTRNQKELLNYMAALTNTFRDFFVKNNIEVFINSLEDITFAVLAYYVAKRLNITVLGILSSRFPKKGLIFCKDFSEICFFNDSNVELDEIKSLYSEATIANEAMMERNEEFYRLNSVPQRFKDLKKVLHYKNFVKNSIKAYEYEKFYFEPVSIWNELKKHVTKFMKINIIHYFLNNFNFNEKFFFFPLHYMQDAQITFREPHVDQIDLIKKISRALPSGYYLYVKPHPHYLGSDLSLSDLFLLKNLENVKFIDPKTKPIQLIKKSVGVITLNSTTGFESLIQNKPVITFGHDFYCRDDISIVIRDMNQLSMKLIEVLNDKSEHVKINEFIKNVYSNTIWIKGYGPSFESCGLHEESGKKVAEKLNDLLISQKLYESEVF